MKRWIFLFGCLVMLAAPALAVEPDEILGDPGLESRARAITKGLRCLVCQGEDIDDLQAPLAADLRRLVRERLKQGDSDAAIIAFLRDRYGDYVLMEPPVTAKTWLLWGAPMLVLCVGGAAAFAFVRRQAKRGE